MVSSYADETRQRSASIRTELLALQKRLPPSVGYGDRNLVVLINPFGERLPLPLEYCFSQDVRLLRYTSSCIPDHPIPSSSSIFRKYVNLLIHCRPVVRSSHPIHKFVISLQTSCLIISPHPLCSSPGSMWTCQFVADMLSDQPVPNRPLYSSPASTWTCQLCFGLLYDNLVAFILVGMKSIPGDNE